MNLSLLSSAEISVHPELTRVLRVGGGGARGEIGALSIVIPTRASGTK